MDKKIFEKNCKSLLNWHQDDEYPFVGERDILQRQLVEKTQLPEGFKHKMLRLVKMLADGTLIWYRVIESPWNNYYGIGYSEYDNVYNIQSFNEVEPIERKEILWRVKDNETVV